MFGGKSLSYSARLGTTVLNYEDGVVAQVVLSNGKKGDYQSLSFPLSLIMFLFADL